MRESLALLRRLLRERRDPSTRRSSSSTFRTRAISGRGAFPADSSAGSTSALALVGNPELLFLDEPTTGFDPSARRQAWEVIANLRELGKTVFLTTHYMDEAQALADRVAIIAGGEIVAEGSPGELVGRGDAAALISFRLPTGVGAGELPREVAATLGDAGAPHPNGQVQLRTDDPVALLNALTALGSGAGPRPGGTRGSPAEPRGRVPGADPASPLTPGRAGAM